MHPRSDRADSGAGADAESSEPVTAGAESLPPTQAGLSLEVLRTRFRQALDDSREMRIEDLLAAVDEAQRPGLFAMLLREEFSWLLSRGEKISMRPYRDRFPGYALQIARTHSELMASRNASAAPPGATGPSRGSMSGTVHDRTSPASAVASASGGPLTASTGKVPAVQPMASGSDGSTESEVRPATTAARYEKRQILASGGMGAIWTAHDHSTRRDVAFKEIRRVEHQSRQFVSRFLNEAQITAQLEHPGIVPVHDVGWQENGCPFYVMRLVQGRTLHVMIRQYHRIHVGSPGQQRELNRLLRIFINLSHAIAYAHSRGVIHRDLKPLNVMVGQFGETQVVDWGLAKPFRRRPRAGETESAAGSIVIPDEPLPDGGRAVGPADSQALTLLSGGAGDGAATSADEASYVPGVHIDDVGESKIPTFVPGGETGATAADDDEDSIERQFATPTQAGAVMGTLDYMAPEQARGELDELDHRSDIFSLGAILFHILTGEPWLPPKMDVKEKVLLAATTPMPGPASQSPQVPGALNAICLKAAAFHAKDRYESAEELAEHIEAWLADQPVPVFNDPWTTVVLRWARKHKTMVVSTFVAAAVLLAARSFWSITSSLQVARMERSVESLIVQSSEALQNGDLRRADELLSRAEGVAGNGLELEASAERVASRRRSLNRVFKVDQHCREVLASVDHVLLDNHQERFPASATQLEVEIEWLQAQSDVDAQLRIHADRLMKDTRQRLTAVQEMISAGQLQASAQRRFEEFRRQFDDVRYFSTRLAGETLATSARQLRRSALRALAVYGGSMSGLTDVTAEADPTAEAAAGGAGPDGNPSASDVSEGNEDLQTGRRPERPRADSQTLAFVSRLAAGESMPEVDVLDPVRQAELKEAVFELLLILAMAELKEFEGESSAVMVAAAQRALAWTDDAERFAVPCSTLWRLRLVALRILPGISTEQLRIAQQSAIRPATSTLDHSRLGDLYRWSNELDEAIFEYRQVLLDEPDDFWARYFLARCLVRGNQQLEALQELAKCINQRPDVAAPYLTRALVIDAGKTLEADREDLRRAEELAPDQYATWITRGIVLGRWKQSQESLAAFARAIQVDDDRPEAFANVAETRIQIANEAMRTNPPDDVRAAEQLQAALEALQSSIDLAPRAALPYRKRGDVYASLSEIAIRRGDAQQAGQLAQRAITELHNALALPIDAGDAAACHESLARLWARAGQFDKVLLNVDSALTLVPDDADLLLMRQEFLRRMGEHEQVIGATSAYLTHGQPHTEVFQNRGRAAQAVGLFREAMQSYTRMLDAGPSPEALNRRGWLYLNRTNDLAFADFDEAIRLQPENPDNFTGRGYARTLNGDDLGGVKDAETAVSLITDRQRETGVVVWPMYSNSAAIYAQAVRAVSRNETLGMAERTERGVRYQTRCVELLRQALAAAPETMHDRVRGAVRNDPAFDPVRQNDEFQGLIGADPASGIPQPSADKGGDRS